MGAFISSSQFVELPFKGESLNYLGNVITFDDNYSDEEIIKTIVNANCDRIQTTREPNDNEISILNEIYKRNTNIGFRFLSIFGSNVDITFLTKLNNLRILYLDIHQKIIDIDTLQKLKLNELSLNCFSVKDYSFLRNIDSSIKSLSVNLEDKTYKMDINDILHMENLETLEIRNVKKGLDKLVEFKCLSNLLFRSIDIKDYSFLNSMNVKKITLCFQKSEYFNTFGINKKIEEINLWRNPKLTDLSFLLQFPNLKKLIIRDQSKITNIPDLKSLSQLEEVYYFCNNDPNLKKHFNDNVKIYTWYNPCDVE